MDVLLGSNWAHLMPKDCCKIKKLRVKTSLFVSGYCLQGTSPAIRKANNINKMKKEIVYAQGIQGIKIQTMRVNIQSERVVSHTCCTHQVSHIPYLEFEEESLSPPRRCIRCKNCVTCSERNKLLTEVENAQLQIIESKIRIDVEHGRTLVEYPFTEDPAILGTREQND